MLVVLVISLTTDSMITKGLINIFHEKPFVIRVNRNGPPGTGYIVDMQLNMS